MKDPMPPGSLRRALFWLALLPLTVPGFAVAGAVYGAWLMVSSACRDLVTAVRTGGAQPAEEPARPPLRVVPTEADR